jgi:imidazole glycerol-phosphate synthase subunit HisH
MQRNPKVTVIDCGHGNLASVLNAFRHLGTEANLTTSPDDVVRAEILVFPGQGSAPTAMKSLRRDGIDQSLREALSRGIPTLGICLGMQLVLAHSTEGPTDCLGIVDGNVERFEPSPEAPKVPHMGWNEVWHEGHGLFGGIPSGSHFYFVHSYYCALTPVAATGYTDYGFRFCSALHAGTLWATQFHPEKSGEAGLRLLRNFLRLAHC